MKNEIQLIEFVACRVMGVSYRMLKGGNQREGNIKRGKRTEAWARFFMFRYLKDNTPYSLEEIGSMYNKDHSTVCYGLNQHDNLLKDKMYKSCYKEFLKQIKNK